jgi:hypothetical protein
MAKLQLPKDPTELSYWVAQAMPLLDEQRLSLLQINSPIQRLRWELCVLEKVWYIWRYNKEFHSELT